MPKPISDDRLIIRFDLDDSIDLDEMADGFKALSRQYKKFLAEKNISEEEAPAKLLVTRLETGSLETELALWGSMTINVLQAMDASLVVSDFSARIKGVIHNFANGRKPENIAKDDAKDFETFLKPLAGRKNSKLSIKTATYHEKTNDREIHASYEFNESDLAHAFTNIGKELGEEDSAPSTHKVTKNVALYWAQTNWVETKTKGRTGDRGIIESLSEKPLPVFFVSEDSLVKHQMTGGHENPSKVAFIVDVSVEYAKGQAVAYTVMELHDTVPLDTEEGDGGLL